MNNIPLEEVYNYQLLQALVHRRTRRIGCGVEIPRGALKFKSQKEPIPLTREETALLCYAGAGITGLAENADIGVGFSQNVTNYGRAYPSACNTQRTYLLFTNDEGVYCYNPRPPQKMVQIETVDDLEIVVQNFDHDVVTLQNERLQMPSAARPLLSPNIYAANQPGQTVFMTVANRTYELINMFFLWAQFEGNYLYDDIAGRPAGDQKWIDKLKLKTKLPLSAAEGFLRTMCAEEAGFITQNILLMAEAIGLGGWPFAGFNNIILLGGSPFAKGLDCHFMSDKKGNLYPVGIDNSPLKANCPPYFKDMDSAVAAIVEDKFGPGGFYDPNLKLSSFKDQRLVVEKVEKIPDDVIQCVKDWCSYLYDTYGRFPVTIDPIDVYLCVGVTHLDLDFYDKYYKSELISETIRNHMTNWHKG